MALRTFLVIDDNAMNRRLVLAVLAHHSCEAVEAETLDAARAELARRRPDAIVLDIQLREGDDSLGFVGELRASPATADLLIVALTAFAMTGDRERFLESGFDGYISKPISVRTFLADLEAIAANRPSRPGSV
jgi:two-component system cell cycle response regulator DivK